jgi:hypothetical protein
MVGGYSSAMIDTASGRQFVEVREKTIENDDAQDH